MKVVLTFFAIVMMLTMSACDFDIFGSSKSKKKITNSEGTFTLKIVIPSTGEPCWESLVEIADTTGISAVLGDEHFPGSQGYPNQFMAHNIDKSLDVRDQVLKVKIRALTQEEHEAIAPHCPQTLIAMPPFIYVTEIVSVE
ncbi:MAG: hypothetical protein CVV22_04770 [Ignavibacteriae bacterium HGW-Ignavibacteriae-1]|jgi:hypothetical protein|nr:MAG: hypothetical protein CVV22_04770 [Ignavibacteriae bacterium HGW-Ignavibacteriae-1]